MKTIVIKEQPLIVLTSHGVSAQDDCLELYAKDLAAANVGDAFDPGQPMVMDGGLWETLTITYKDSNGVGALLRQTVYEDGNEDEVLELFWFEIR